MDEARVMRIGRYTVYRSKLDAVKQDLVLYSLRRARRDILRAKYEERDPEDYYSYRSPQCDGQPGAPEHVGDPTLNRVISIMETQELAYLEAWVGAVEMVLDQRLDEIQRTIIEDYVMIPPKRRGKTLEAVVEEKGVARREAFYRMNEALLEFAFALIGENKVCTNHALQTSNAVVS